MYKTYMIIDSKELLYISIVMIQAFDKLVYDILITREPSSEQKRIWDRMIMSTMKKWTTVVRKQGILRTWVRTETWDWMYQNKW